MANLTEVSSRSDEIETQRQLDPTGVEIKDGCDKHRWSTREEDAHVIESRVRLLALYLLFSDCVEHVLTMNDVLGAAPLRPLDPLRLRDFESCQQLLLTSPVDQDLNCAIDALLHTLAEE